MEERKLLKRINKKKMKLEIKFFKNLRKRNKENVKRPRRLKFFGENFISNSMRPKCASKNRTNTKRG